MKIFQVIFIVLLFQDTSAESASPGEVTVYSARKEHLIKPVFAKFEKITGIKVNYLTGKSPALLERIKAEGKNTKADIFMTVDAGNLWAASEADLFQQYISRVLKKNIPSYLKDPKDRWFSFSVRARTIVYNSKKIKPSELSTYENLGEKTWKKRLCLRSSKKVYNQSLVAMLIEQLGEKKTEQVVKSWVENLATSVFSNDTRLMEAIIAGQCDIGIVNSYYFGRLQKAGKEKDLKLFWPNQETMGVHINVSGAGLLKHAKNRKNAQKLLDWLSSPEAQKMFADLNLECSLSPILTHPFAKF